MKLIEHLPTTKCDAPFGVEVEMEYARRPKLPLEMEHEFFDYLNVVNEGSLRGHANEIITRKNVTWDNWFRVKKLFTKYFRCNLPRPSERASVHVHINMQNTEVVHVFNAMVLWWWMENLLIRYSGPERRGNLFCLGLRETGYFPRLLAKDIKAGYGLTSLIHQEDRYAALNLLSLPKLGTLEFRSMKACKEIEIVDKWMRMCYTLCKSAEEFDDPTQLLDEVYRFDPKDMIYNVFQEKATVEALTDYPEWRDDLNENLGPLCNFVYGIDWKNIQPLKKKPNEDGPVNAMREWRQLIADHGVGNFDLRVVGGGGGGGVVIPDHPPEPEDMPEDDGWMELDPMEEPE